MFPSSQFPSIQSIVTFSTIIIALESTSVYNILIANYLASRELLTPFNTYVYCLTPKMTVKYRKLYVNMDKTELMNAFLVSDFAKVNLTKNTNHGVQPVSCFKKTYKTPPSSCRMHYQRKNYMVSNLYLKFSELRRLDDDSQLFSNIYSKILSAILTEFMSLQETI